MPASSTHSLAIALKDAITKVLHHELMKSNSVPNPNAETRSPPVTHVRRARSRFREPLQSKVVRFEETRLGDFIARLAREVEASESDEETWEDIMDVAGPKVGTETARGTAVARGANRSNDSGTIGVLTFVSLLSRIWRICDDAASGESIEDVVVAKCDNKAVQCAAHGDTVVRENSDTADQCTSENEKFKREYSDQEVQCDFNMEMILSGVRRRNLEAKHKDEEARRAAVREYSDQPVQCNFTLDLIRARTLGYPARISGHPLRTILFFGAKLKVENPRDRLELLNLPQELRDEIFTLAMDVLPTRFIISDCTEISKQVFYPKTLPPAAFVSKGLREQVILAWIRRTRFIFESSSTEKRQELYDFLSQFPNGLQSVRMLAYHGLYHYGRPNLDSESTQDERGRLYTANAFSRLCPGLTSLVLQIDAPNLVGTSEAERVGNIIWYMETKADLRINWQFNELFKSPSLKVLKIVWTNVLKYAGYVRTKPEELLIPVTELLTEGFEEQGKKTEVELSGKKDMVLTIHVRGRARQ